MHMYRPAQPLLTPLHWHLAGISAVAIALGHSHTCAIVTGGGVKCWGRNDAGQLGIGSKADATLPTDVAGDRTPAAHTHTLDEITYSGA
jgi:alpha-tubulin suppressor-like RCC1 family protein